MRILKIDVPGTFHSTNDEVTLNAREYRDLLFAELERLRPDLAEGIRERLSAYFPIEFEKFVRIDFDPATNGMRTRIWIDLPNIRWSSGLLVRRAWNLSVPILAHVIREAVAERVENIDLAIDQGQTAINSYAPTRFWKDPLILTGLVFVLAGVYWLLVHPQVAQMVQRYLAY